MIAPEKRCAPEDHCFHRDGTFLMSWPPQYKKTCCHCGHVEIEKTLTRKSPGEHGPFYRE